MIDSSLYHTETIRNHTFRLRKLPGGTFLMGSEEKELAWGREDPIHPVELSPFHIGEYPVTQALWMAVMEGRNPSHFVGSNRPVEQVSWLDVVGERQKAANGLLSRLIAFWFDFVGKRREKADAFLPRLNEWTTKTRPPGWIYRLPTEAEWEYAARVGMAYTYSGSDQLKEVSWNRENSHGETKPVGLKRSNDWGLFDMSGNVFEWCQDWLSEEYYADCLAQGKVMNPQGPDKGRRRVLRGGSWFLSPRFCRVSCRINFAPTARDDCIGFRLVLAPR